jgi:pilus biogenesis lipoprotein CpaD
MQIKRLIVFAGMSGIAFALSACSPTTASQVEIGKMRVKEKMVTETLDMRHMDAAKVAILASDIVKNGRSDVSLTVPYLPGAAGAAARARGAEYKHAFTAQGVKNISVAFIPVSDRQYADNAVIAYVGIKAYAAEGCNRIPGYQGGATMDDMEGYSIGCETQAAMAKMIADPSDLLGKAGTPDGDSRRSGTIIEPYRAGTPNQPLKGMQASNISQ